MFVKTSPGRQRLNVLAALNPFQNELIEISNTGYINADTVCKFLHKIHENDKQKPITLVLNNARYQRCKKVQELADEFQRELLFLPPYSPNLNLMERLWKFLKKKIIKNRYYESFHDFYEAIFLFFQNWEQYLPELKNLFALNFEII